MPASKDTLNTRRDLDGRRQDLQLLQPGGRRLELGPEMGDVSRLPYSMKVLLENLLRFEDGNSVTVDDIKADRRLAEGQALRPRDRLPPGPRADAGLHRRARRGRPGGHARGHGQAGRRSRRRSIRSRRSTW